MNIYKKALLVVSVSLFAGSIVTGQERRFLPMGAQPDELPRQGSHEATFSGTGESDRDFDNGSLSLEGSYGWYTTDKILLSLRQTISNIGSRRNWTGSTLLAADYHFLERQWRPFLGVNAGFRYGGRSVGDSFAAGAQTGLKYYFTGNAFLFGRADYSYTFDRARDIDAWDRGRWGYGFGLGLNF